MGNGMYKIYREEREKGLTYREIADKYNVTWQNVQRACGKVNAQLFRVVTAEKCIYPNLRKWMNLNKVGNSELLRRMDMLPGGTNQSRLRELLKGTYQPRKPMIDKLIVITGMPYEKLFEVEV